MKSSVGVLRFVAATNVYLAETRLRADSWVFLLLNRNRSTKSHEAAGGVYVIRVASWIALLWPGKSKSTNQHEIELCIRLKI